MGRSGRAAIYEAPNTPFIIKDIVDSRFPLSELGTAFKQAAERSVLRAPIVP